jgi:hypothetical protein
MRSKCSNDRCGPFGAPAIVRQRGAPRESSGHSAGHGLTVEADRAFAAPLAVAAECGATHGEGISRGNLANLPRELRRFEETELCGLGLAPLSRGMLGEARSNWHGDGAILREIEDVNQPSGR